MPEVPSTTFQLALLHRITRAVAQQLEMTQVYSVVCETLENDLPADFCLLASYNRAHNMLTPQAIGPKSTPLANALNMGMGSQVSAYGVHIEQAVNGTMAYQPNLAEKRGPIGVAMHKHGGLHSLILHPLKKVDEVLGVVVIGRKQAHAFDRSELAFLEHLTEHIALALAQTTLLQELRESNENLRRTQSLVLQQERLRALAEMAAGVAHDINNAISPASIYVEALLSNERGLSPKGQRQLLTVQMAIEDVANTVARMGEFTREADPDRPVTQKAEPNRISFEAIEFTRPRWQSLALRKGLQIQVLTDHFSDLPHAQISESELRELLTNLLFNAIDAMPEGGQLCVRTSLACADFKTYVLLEVSDNGVGMEPQTLQQCMEPFFTSKGARGSGLGLSMVYGTLQRCGGFLDIDSTPGKGTVVRVFLPPAQGEDDNLLQSEAANQISQKPLHILVVDDEQMVIESTTDLLISAGHRVAAVTNPHKALEYFEDALAKQMPFDAVITDLGMPGLDGQAVAQRVKQLSPSTPVLLLTGWGTQIKQQKLVTPNVDCVLAKPVRKGELLHRLQTLHSASQGSAA